MEGKTTKNERLSLVEDEQDSDMDVISQREGMQLLAERLAKDQWLGHGADKKVVDILDGENHQVMVGDTKRTRMYTVIRTQQGVALQLLERSGVNAWNVEPLERYDKWPEPYDKTICVDWQDKRNNESWWDFRMRMIFHIAHLRQEPVSKYLARQLEILSYASKWE